jgi:hypothetical protein
MIVFRRLTLRSATGTAQHAVFYLLLPSMVRLQFRGREDLLFKAGAGPRHVQARFAGGMDVFDFDLNGLVASQLDFFETSMWPGVFLFNINLPFTNNRA